MAESAQQTSHIDPMKALELLKESASWTPYRCDALKDVGDDESAQMIEALAKYKEVLQHYVILLKFGLLTNEEFTKKIRTLVGSEV